MDALSHESANDIWASIPMPEPSLGHAAYVWERRLALMTSPRRLWNYLKCRSNGRTSARVNYLPIRMDIENVSRCNFHCTMCQVSEWPRQQRAGDMSLEDFRQLLDEQYGLVEIKLQGMGEPLLQGDPFFEMIRLARRRHIWVRTTTNASLLHLRDNYKKLIDTGVNEVQISIEGADKETFESIRRGAHFETILRNCKMINDYCDQVGRHPTKMWTVVQRGNVHQMRDLVTLAAQLGFKSQVFALNLVSWGDPEWRKRNDEVTVTDRFTPDDARELMRLGEELGVSVRFWNSHESFSVKEPLTRCPWPFERAYVSSDLRVVPCCLIANPDAYEVKGEGGMSAVWHSDTFREFRETHIKGNVPAACAGCYRN